MQNTTILTEHSIGCWLDNHRGHYITRDAIELAVGYGFIIGGMERFVLDAYEDHGNDENYPFEELTDLCDAAVQWLNSGQDQCARCVPGSHGVGWPGPGYEWETRTDDKGRAIPGRWVICRACSGTGRGPREHMQNFPPIVPDGAVWMFYDGDFGLYRVDDEGEPVDNDVKYTAE